MLVQKIRFNCVTSVLYARCIYLLLPLTVVGSFLPLYILLKSSSTSTGLSQDEA